MGHRKDMNTLDDTTVLSQMLQKITKTFVVLKKYKLFLCGYFFVIVYGLRYFSRQKMQNDPREMARQITELNNRVNLLCQIIVEMRADATHIRPIYLPTLPSPKPQTDMHDLYRDNH